jgi:hypothetical protein
MLLGVIGYVLHHPFEKLGVDSHFVNVSNPRLHPHALNCICDEPDERCATQPIDV